MKDNQPIQQYQPSTIGSNMGDIGIDVFIEFVPIPDYTKPFVSDIMKKTTNEFSGD